jgi:hypothetical protein
MAPSNLNQVFVANAASTPTTPALTSGLFSQVAASGLAANSRFGIYNLKTNTYLSGAGSTTSLMTSTGVALNSALTSIQVTQTMLSGNAIATPIIDVKSIKRIAITKFAAPVRHEIEGTFGSAVPTGDSFIFKISLRTYPTVYEAFANPNNPNLDLSTGGKVFPLLGNFSAGRNVISVVEIPSSTSATNCALAVRNAIQNNPTLNAIFTASAAAGVLTITARHMGVIFDVACNSTLTYAQATGFTTTVTGFDKGSGHYINVISEEKAQRARYGNFNRMYFPMDFPTFAQSGTSYDAIDISYEHNWPSSTGIARAGELNNVRIYFPSVGVAANTNVEDVLAFGNSDVATAVLTAGPGTVTEFYF